MKEFTKADKRHWEELLFNEFGIRFNIQRSGAVKRIKTIVKKYGTLNYLDALGKLEEREIKRKATNNQRYNQEHTNTPVTIAKANVSRKKTMNERYGVNAPMQIQEVKDKQQASTSVTCLERYGMDHPFRVGEFKKKSITNSRIFPNKAEKKLFNLLKPLGFIYTGDCTLAIRVNKQVCFPDFINEPKKMVVEMFGEHWHKPGTEPIKIAFYEAAGYECLIIWEKELKDSQTLNSKINSFIESVETKRQGT